MPKTKQRPTTLARGDRVRAAQDLRGVPRGTPGTVMLVSGLTWVRYWVRFDNGTEIGQLHRDKLVRDAAWDQWLTEQEARAERDAEAAARAATATPPSTAGGPAPAGEPGAVSAEQGAPTNPAASKIPAHLLERSRLARQRRESG